MKDDRDLFLEVSGTSEDETDFGPISKAELASVAIATTDWTTETVLSQLSKGNVHLTPSFQRRDAWEAKRKSQFIESLILGLPVPQIVLAEASDNKGTYLVLDGKQRLLCLRQFTAKEDDLVFASFKLSGLVVRTDLNGRSFKEITEEPRYRAELNAFENYGIRAVILKNWKTEKLLGHVFLRLNMGSKPLSPQELRQALHPGPFLDFADDASIKSRAIRDILRINDPDFRMRDVELLIRYFSFRHVLDEYRGNLKEFLDLACAKFNRGWSSLKNQFEREVGELDSNHQIIKTAFGSEYNYGKWVSGVFETRFNRAVFDVLQHALTDPTIQAEALSDPNGMTTAFKALCASDPAFIEAIERTTKSIEATRYRLDAWYRALNKEFNISVNPPKVGK